MADSKKLNAVRRQLECSVSLEGKLSEMLCAGLPHALDGRPEDRHAMQASVLTMAIQVLGTDKQQAHAAEAASKQKLEATQAELDTLKGVLESVNSEVEVASAAVVAQKHLLAEFKRRVHEEEYEHKALSAADKEGAKVMAGIEKQKNQVDALLASIDQKGMAKDLEEFLRDSKAEHVLIAALPAVLDKDPSERVNFDLVVVSSVKDFLRQQVASLSADIDAEVARQADTHAEAVGAFAIFDLAKERVAGAATDLSDLEAAEDASHGKHKDATSAVHQSERVLGKAHSEVAAAEKVTARCCEAVDALKYLETPPAEEAPAVPDVEMSAPVAAPPAKSPAQSPAKVAPVAASPVRTPVAAAAVPDVEMAAPQVAY